MKLMKPADAVIFIFSLLLIVGFSAFAVDRNSGKSHVYIRSDQGEYLYSLERDAEITVQGPLGDTHIEIKDGEARILDSPCRDKLCVLEGAFSKPGKWTACLPNRVFVSIKGIKTEDAPIDDTSY